MDPPKNAKKHRLLILYCVIVHVGLSKLSSCQQQSLATKSTFKSTIVPFALRNTALPRHWSWPPSKRLPDDDTEQPSVPSDDNDLVDKMQSLWTPSPSLSSAPDPKPPPQQNPLVGRQAYQTTSIEIQHPLQPGQCSLLLRLLLQMRAANVNIVKGLDAVIGSSNMFGALTPTKAVIPTLPGGISNYYPNQVSESFGAGQPPKGPAGSTAIVQVPPLQFETPGSVALPPTGSTNNENPGNANRPNVIYGPTSAAELEPPSTYNQNAINQQPQPQQGNNGSHWRQQPNSVQTQLPQSPNIFNNAQQPYSPLAVVDGRYPPEAPNNDNRVASPNNAPGSSAFGTPPAITNDLQALAAQTINFCRVHPYCCSLLANMQRQQQQAIKFDLPGQNYVDGKNTAQNHGSIVPGVEPSLTGQGASNFGNGAGDVRQSDFPNPTNSNNYRSPKSMTTTNANNFGVLGPPRRYPAGGSDEITNKVESASCNGTNCTYTAYTTKNNLATPGKQQYSSNDNSANLGSSYTDPGGEATNSLVFGLDNNNDSENFGDNKSTENNSNIHKSSNFGQNPLGPFINNVRAPARFNDYAANGNKNQSNFSSTTNFGAYKNPNNDMFDSSIFGIPSYSYTNVAEPVNLNSNNSTVMGPSPRTTLNSKEESEFYGRSDLGEKTAAGPSPRQTLHRPTLTLPNVSTSSAAARPGYSVVRQSRTVSEGLEKLVAQLSNASARALDALASNNMETLSAANPWRSTDNLVSGVSTLPSSSSSSTTTPIVSADDERMVLQILRLMQLRANSPTNAEKFRRGATTDGQAAQKKLESVQNAITTDNTGRTADNEKLDNFNNFDGHHITKQSILDPRSDVVSDEDDSKMSEFASSASGEQWTPTKSTLYSQPRLEKVLWQTSGNRLLVDDNFTNY